MKFIDKQNDEQYKMPTPPTNKNINAKSWHYTAEELKEDLEFLEAKQQISGGNTGLAKAASH